MKIIGITGGVGAGKSQILSYLDEKYKAKVVLADDIGNEVKEPGEECYEKIVGLLGTGILQDDGTIDKGLMAKAIFADKELLKQVNEIIHPAVIGKIRQKAKDAEKSEVCNLFVIEAALLIGSGLEPMLDELWYIYTDMDVRISRLMSSRGYSAEKCESIISKQLTDEQFRAAADVIIDNSGDIEATYRQIDEKLSKTYGE